MKRRGAIDLRWRRLTGSSGLRRSALGARWRVGWLLTFLLSAGNRDGGWRLFTVGFGTDLGGGSWAMAAVLSASERGVRVASGSWDWATSGGSVARAAIFSRNGELGALGSSVSVSAKVDDGVSILGIVVWIIDIHTTIEALGGAIDSKLAVLDGPLISAITRTHHNDRILTSALDFHGKGDLVVELLSDGARALIKAKLLRIRGLWVGKAVVDGSTLMDAVDAIVVELAARGSQLKRVCGGGGSTQRSNGGELHF